MATLRGLAGGHLDAGGLTAHRPAGTPEPPRGPDRARRPPRPPRAKCWDCRAIEAAAGSGTTRTAPWNRRTWGSRGPGSAPKSARGSRWSGNKDNNNMSASRAPSS
ncbi:hypothetical protein ON010_g15208 [Phytophthora cinnamomi]|nr:hypothetical protein ON010_g15208 [Phytophthora cinnamomi]